MGIYAKINENIGDMLIELCGSEIIQKLLTNSKSSALSDSLPSGFKGLDLLNDKIFDIPKTKDPETEDGANIFAYFNDSNLAGSVNQYDMIVDIVLVFHKNSWSLDLGKKRPLEICDEIDRLIKGAKTSSIRGSWQIFKPAKFIRISDNFDGYMSRWVVTNSNVECGV